MSTSTSSLNVLAIGASKNIGYFTSLRLLNAGATVTFLLRSPSGFDGDQEMQKYIKDGKARTVKGDALIKDDVQRVWNEASSSRPVDVVLFTLGGVPSLTLSKGFVMTPPNLVTKCVFNVLETMPEACTPRIVVISSTGLTRSSHAALPTLMKPLYGILLDAPHRDKLGVERLMSHCAGWSWNTEADGEPNAEIMGEGDWTKREGVPAAGSLKDVLVVRPAFLTDGPCLADDPKKSEKGKSYRVSEGDLGGYTVSRKDVAHFIAGAILTRWDEFGGKRISVGY